MAESQEPLDARKNQTQGQQGAVQAPTDRVKGLHVVLEHDLDTEAANKLMEAIAQMRGVIAVTGEVVDFDSLMAEERARRVLGQRLLEVVYPREGRRGG